MVRSRPRAGWQRPPRSIPWRRRHLAFPRAAPLEILSDAIVAGTLGQINMASILAQPRTLDTIVPADALPGTVMPAPAAGAIAAQAAPKAAERAKNLFEEANSG